jgi:hypothetical protein
MSVQGFENGFEVLGLSCMTRLMEQAIERLRAMPESKQDQLARFLLAELEEDEKWSRCTAEHEEKLKGFVEKMLADDAGGDSEPLDPDRL